MQVFPTVPSPTTTHLIGRPLDISPECFTDVILANIHYYSANKLICIYLFDFDTLLKVILELKYFITSSLAPRTFKDSPVLAFFV